MARPGPGRPATPDVARLARATGASAYSEYATRSFFRPPAVGAAPDDHESEGGACWALLTLVCSILVFFAKESAYDNLAERRAKGGTKGFAGVVDEWSHANLAGPNGDNHYRLKLVDRGEVDALTLFGIVHDMFDEGD